MHILKYTTSLKLRKKGKGSSAPLLISESLKEIDGKNVFLATYPLLSHCMCAESLLPSPTIFFLCVCANQDPQLLRAPEAKFIFTQVPMEYKSTCIQRLGTLESFTSVKKKQRK